MDRIAIAIFLMSLSLFAEVLPEEPLTCAQSLHLAGSYHPPGSLIRYYDSSFRKHDATFLGTELTASGQSRLIVQDSKNEISSLAFGAFISLSGLVSRLDPGAKFSVKERPAMFGKTHEGTVVGYVGANVLQYEGKNGNTEVDITSLDQASLVVYPANSNEMLNRSLNLDQRLLALRPASQVELTGPNFQNQQGTFWGFQTDAHGNRSLAILVPAKDFPSREKIIRSVPVNSLFDFKGPLECLAVGTAVSVPGIDGTNKTGKIAKHLRGGPGERAVLLESQGGRREIIPVTSFTENHFMILRKPYHWEYQEQALQRLRNLKQGLPILITNFSMRSYRGTFWGVETDNDGNSNILMLVPESNRRVLHSIPIQHLMDFRGPLESLDPGVRFSIQDRSLPPGQLRTGVYVGHERDPKNTFIRYRNATGEERLELKHLNEGSLMFPDPK